MKFHLTYFLLIYIPIYSGYSQEDDWKLQKNSDGIEVYTRDVEDWSFHDIKVFTNMDESLHSLVACLKDVSAYTCWAYACERAFILDSIGEREEYFYAQFDAPWPIKDRYILIHSIVEQDTSTGEINFFSESLPGSYYESAPDDLVRMPFFSSNYRLVPKDDGTVDVHYWLRLDPGGWLPAWLVNMASTIGPYSSFVKFRDFVKKEKYQRMEYRFIEDVK